MWDFYNVKAMFNTFKKVISIDGAYNFDSHFFSFFMRKSLAKTVHCFTNIYRPYKASF